eukprot:gb/GECG01008599.1/.p1 GENE.gb/GECG01008599.1/~~gb/GECG01008599.1/.p1  ORF type:complete len:129 (+),score=6.60 gb/GECG01008599.1/:1-387(+)
MVPQEQCLLSLEGHTSHVFTVDFCPGDPNVVVSGGYDHSIRIWDLRQKYCVRTIPAHAGPVSSVSCSSDGLAVASGSFDGVWYVLIALVSFYLVISKYNQLCAAGYGILQQGAADIRSSTMRRLQKCT